MVPRPEWQRGVRQLHGGCLSGALWPARQPPGRRRLGTVGHSGNPPVAGDWAGTGEAQIGVFDPSTGLWKLDRNGNGQLDSCTVDGCLGPFGISGDLPVAGDWTGTGKAQIGVFDPS